MTYNGWTNWETWITQLHIFDGLTAEDFGHYNEITGRDCRDYAETVIEIGESQRNGFVADIIGGFMSSVNWDEIAEHLNEGE